MARNSASMVDYLARAVILINVTLLIISVVTFATIREDIADNWKNYPRKPIVSDIPYDYIFGLTIFCISTGFLHTILWYIAERIDNTCLMKASITIGILKEIVSFSSLLLFVYCEIASSILNFRWKLPLLLPF